MANLLKKHGSSLDPDCQAFLTATGISDPTISTAICVFVAALKTAGIWDKSYCLYPFVGGTADTHHYNLKDPQDTDAAFRIDLWNDITHDSGGVHPDSADTGSNARTTFSPSADLSADSMMYTGAIADNTTNDGYVMGQSGGVNMLSRNALSGGFFSAANLINDGTGVADGCISLGNNDTDSILYKNGSHLKTVSGGWTPVAALVFAVAGTGKADLGAHLFSAITEFLDATEVSDFHDAISTLNDTLGRKTW